MAGMLLITRRRVRRKAMKNNFAKIFAVSAAVFILDNCKLLMSSIHMSALPHLELMKMGKGHHIRNSSFPANLTGLEMGFPL